MNLCLYYQEPLSYPQTPSASPSTYTDLFYGIGFLGNERDIVKTCLDISLSHVLIIFIAQYEPYIKFCIKWSYNKLSPLCKTLYKVHTEQ